MQDGAAEDGEPDNTEQGREQPLDQDELTQGTAIRHTHHEQAQQRCIRHPVHPPVHIPALRPICRIRIRGGIQACREEFIDVFAQAFGEQVTDVTGWPGKEDEQQQDEKQLCIPVGQLGDAVAQATDGRSIIAQEHHDNNNRIYRQVRRKAGKRIQRRRPLHSAVAQAARDRRRQREGGNRVECICPAAFRYIFAEDRHQQRACAERRAFIQNHIREDYAHNNAACIRCQAPLQEAVQHAPEHRTVAARRKAGAGGRLHCKQQRFRRAPEHNARTDTGAKRDAEPLDIAEFRFGIRAAQFDLTNWGDHNDNAQNNHKQDDKADRPAQSIHQVIHNQIVQDIVKAFRIDNDCNQHRNEQNDRYRHDCRFNLYFLFVSHVCLLAFSRFNVHPLLCEDADPSTGTWQFLQYPPSLSSVTASAPPCHCPAGQRSQHTI